MTASSIEKSAVPEVESTRPAALAGAPRRSDATLVQPVPVAKVDGPADSPAVPHLVLLSGAESGKQVWFRAPVTTVGRAQDNELVIPEIGVSRHHARFERDADAVVLRDERSGNGTRVNGRKTKRRSLRDGDVVQVGATRLRFVDPGGRRSTRVWYAAAALLVFVSTAAGARLVWQARATQRSPLAAQVRADDANPAKPVEHAAGAVEDRAMPAGAVAVRARAAGAVEGRAETATVVSPAPAAAPRATPSAASPVHAGAAPAHHARARSATAAARAAATAASPPLAADGVRFEQARREGMARLAENKLPEALRAFEEARRENPTPELARIIASLHLRSSLSLMSTDAGLPAAAAEIHAALDDEPQDEQAGRALKDIETRCRELYLRGYVAKEDDPASAKAAFEIVISALPEGDQTAQKAKHWFEKLGGKAPIDD